VAVSWNQWELPLVSDTIVSYAFFTEEEEEEEYSAQTAKSVAKELILFYHL